MTANDSYQQFLEAKVQVAEASGFQVDEAEINPKLKPFTRAIVRWALEGGRRAIFASFGLHKTATQIEIMRILQRRIGGRCLIVLPLGVRQEFMRDAANLFQDEFAVTLRFVRSIDEASEPGVYLTNYETVRDGKLDPNHFDAASLDEASCLRGFGGSKTFREFMRLFTGVRYRFVATATPAPNEFIELLAYAAFLDVMDVGQAKTRFFRRNSEKADTLTIHPHKEREFWLWVASWGLFVQRPSDLGFSDAGYAFPPIEIRWHEIPSDHSAAGMEKGGQGRLFRNAAAGIVDAAAEKRASLPARIAKLLEIRGEDPDVHRIVWHDLEAERLALEAALPIRTYGAWEEYRDGHPRGLELYEHHYSAHRYADGRERNLFAGPGFKTVLLSRDRNALFVWRKFIDDSGQQGINCAVFRNEGAGTSSELIREAMAIAWMRWPGERLYTYVDPQKVRSSNPGYCFQQAGWTKAGWTKGGLLILQALPGCSVPDLHVREGIRSVYGNQELGEREDTIIGFSDGLFQELAAKPVIAGSGCNFQRHCAWAVFLGIGFKFNDFIQAIHRVQRFGQARPVRIDLIYTEAERDVRRTLEAKWRRHEELVQKMTDIIKTYGLSNEAMAQTLTRSMGVERIEVQGDGYRLINNDCVREITTHETDSVDLIVTSIPFSTQYEYSPNYADFGHTDDNPHFWRQMDFLVPELLRVLRPGRVACIHVKDRIVPGGMTGLGFQTVYPFADDCRAAFRKAGFAYLGEKTSLTDVVRENNQTYRLGHTEQLKDGSRMGAGLPEKVLIFRKPPSDCSDGYADTPVVKPRPTYADRDGQVFAYDRKAEQAGKTRPIPGTGYSRARWQIDAHHLMRSSGDRLMAPEEWCGFEAEQIYKLWRQYSLTSIYDFEHHVLIGEHLEARGKLPPTFMLLPPHSWHPDVWTDVAQMLSLNTLQAQAGAEKHLCPLPFDIVDRLIVQFSQPGEVVLDPFGGLMTVPYRAIKLGRKSIGVELSPKYFLDGVKYVEAMAREMAMPTLFDLLDQQPDQAAE